MVLALALTACSSQPAATVVTRDSSFASVVDKPAQSRPFALSLGFVGDICLADNYSPMQRLAYMGSTNIEDGIDAQFVQMMNSVDLMWVNNEFVFSNRGEPLSGKAYTFCGATENVSYLHDLGVDIAGLANNHVFDYGEEAFLDTLATLEQAGIPVVGAGKNDTQAYAPVYLHVDDVTIAYVAASRAEYTIYTLEATASSPGIAWCYENDRFLASIREAAANADYVIALPHWGVEHSTTLEDVQIDSAHSYIDAGADAVIGAHPHILQGIEYYNGKPILYSLGNFWFDGYDIDTALAEVRIRGTIAPNGAIEGTPDVQVVLHPGLQSGVFTSWEEGTQEGARILSDLESICVNVTISDDGVVHPR